MTSRRQPPGQPSLCAALVPAPLGPLLAGLGAGAAVLIRPNLAALALVPALAVTLGQRPASGVARLGRLAAFGAGLLPGCLAVAWINSLLYGSPLSSGYGSLAVLFEWSSAGPNLRQFVTWLVESQTPIALLGLVGVPLVPARPLAGMVDGRAVRVLLGGLILTTWLSYLFYRPFDAWWYLRFLLPSWPAMMVVAAVVCERVAVRLGLVRSGALVILIAVGVAVLTTGHARQHGVFRLWADERRYVDVGHFLEDGTEANTIFISLQHSGSVRFYGGRSTIRFDWLDPQSLDTCVQWLRTRGFHPFFLLEEWEEPAFRERFAPFSALGRLDWIPRAVLTKPVRVSLYDPLDRGRETAPVRIPASGRTGCRPSARWGDRGGGPAGR